QFIYIAVISIVLFSLSSRIIYSFYFNATATTKIYTLSLHDALPIFEHAVGLGVDARVARGEQLHRPERPAARAALADEQTVGAGDRKSTRLNSSHVANSYAVFCLKKKKKNQTLALDHIQRKVYYIST